MEIGRPVFGTDFSDLERVCVDGREVAQRSTDPERQKCAERHTWLLKVCLAQRQVEEAGGQGPKTQGDVSSENGVPGVCYHFCFR